MNVEQIDKDIQRATIEYDILAYQSQIAQKRRKTLEAQKVLAVERAAIAELEQKVAHAEEALAKL